MSLNLVLPEDESLYNPRLLTESDIRDMDNEEIFQFNSIGDALDAVEEILGLLKGNGADYDIDQLLIGVLMLKSRLRVTAIPV